MKNLYPVILAGGSGTRLWPVSRVKLPKQFIKIFGNHSLFQKSFVRNRLSDNSPMAITGEEHKFIVQEQLEDLGTKTEVILEPEGKDTFAACLIGALRLMQRDSEAIMLITPADHLIDDESYAKTIEDAYQVATAGHFVTLGIKPTFPHIGYGYIEKAQALEGLSNAYKVQKFHEKPEYKIAEKYYKSESHYWNAGIFLFPVKEFIAEAEKFHPETVKLCRAAIKDQGMVDDIVALERSNFMKLDKISVDYAILEKSSNVAVVLGQFDWNDIGSWDSFADVSTKDQDNNAITGTVETIDTKDCLINSNNDRLVVTVGVEDLIVINTDDAVLISGKDKSHLLKDAVSKLKSEQRQEVVSHTDERRPWGYFRIINEGNRYKAKKLVIYPHQRISLQYHHKRSEHWVVVEGTAKITLGDKDIILSENESVYIPKTVKHRVENIGETNLKIIEVQTGAYLGEDDIVRIDDNYKRL